jgi:cytochrome P450
VSDAKSGGPRSFVPPKPKPLTSRLSLLGGLIRARRSWFSVLTRKNYRNFTGEWWTPLRKLFIVSHPDLVDQVLVKDAAHFPKSDLMAKVLSLLLGNGIFVSNGEVWRKQRRMMEPAFTQARIQDVFPLMREATLAMGARLRDADHGSVLAVDEEMTHVTGDIIFRTIFSRALKRDEAIRIFYAFGRLQELLNPQGVWALLGIPRFLWFGRRAAVKHAEVIRALLDSDVEARLSQSAAGSPERADILGSLLKAVDPETGDRFSRKELVDQIALVFMAGHETSASALAFALYLISVRADIQERMHEEAVAAFGDREPEFSDVRHLRLTRDVLRETLRLYPTLPLLGREATRVEHMRSRLIKPGSLVFVSPWIIQRHRKLWDRPDEFDPDRFSRPETKESIRSAYLPFSAGPRVCLGASFAMQEGVLILAYLVRHFRFQPVPGHEPQPVARLTLRAENGVRLHILHRETAAKAGPAPARASAVSACPVTGHSA